MKRIKLTRSSRRERPWLEVLPLDPGTSSWSEPRRADVRRSGLNEGSPSRPRRVGLMQVGDPQEVRLWEHIARARLTTGLGPRLLHR